RFEPRWSRRAPRTSLRTAPEPTGPHARALHPGPDLRARPARDRVPRAREDLAPSPAQSQSFMSRGFTTLNLSVSKLVHRRRRALRLDVRTLSATRSVVDLL